MRIERNLAFIGVALLAMVLAASTKALWPTGLPAPEVGLLVVLYLGLSGRATAPGQVVVALFIGYLNDLLSGAPRGLHALVLGLFMVIGRAASNRLQVVGVWQQVVVVFLATLGYSALVVALAAPMYDGVALTALRSAPATAVLTAFFAPLLFALCRSIDQRFSPDPPTLKILS